MAMDAAPEALTAPRITAPLAPTGWQRTPVLLFLLLIAAAIPALGALGAPFFIADDATMIAKNPYVNGERPVLEAFVKPYFNHYAPLHIIGNKVQYALFGPSALGFRLSSILLHFFAAAACWYMLNMLTRRRLLGYGVAALWAMHAIQSESVAWIVEQKTLWFGAFAFLAVGIYADTRRPAAQRLILALLLMMIGGLGKASVIVVFPLVLLIEVILRHDGGGKLPLRLARTLPFALATVAFVAVTIRAHHQMELISAGRWSILDAVLNMPGALLIHLRIAFLPWTASFFHEMERVTSFASPAFFGNLLLLAAIAGGAIAVVKPAQRRLVAFCALAWVAGIGPMLNLSIWIFPAYDRFQYTGLPFLYLGTALLVENLFERAAIKTSTPNTRAIVWSGALVLTGLFGLSRGILYGSEEAVARDAVAKAPKNAYSHTALANTLYPEYVRAAKEGRRAEQLRLAAEIGHEAELASQCWNFRDFLHMPVNLLAMAGDVARECEMYETAERLLQAALAEPKWAEFYKAPSASAKSSLGRTKLEFADKLLSSPVTMDSADPVIRRALAKIEEARALGAAADEGYLLEAIAYEALSRLAKARQDAAAAAAHVARAKEALKGIGAASALYARAQELRGRLE